MTLPTHLSIWNVWVLFAKTYSFKCWNPNLTIDPQPNNACSISGLRRIRKSYKISSITTRRSHQRGRCHLKETKVALAITFSTDKTPSNQIKIVRATATIVNNLLIHSSHTVTEILEIFLRLHPQLVATAGCLTRLCMGTISSMWILTLSKMEATWWTQIAILNNKILSMYKILTLGPSWSLRYLGNCKTKRNQIL